MQLLHFPHYNFWKFRFFEKISRKHFSGNIYGNLFFCFWEIVSKLFFSENIAEHIFPENIFLKRFPGNVFFENISENIFFEKVFFPEKILRKYFSFLKRSRTYFLFEKFFLEKISRKDFFRKGFCSQAAARDRGREHRVAV